MIVDAFGREMTDSNFNNLDMRGDDCDWVAEIEFMGTGLYFMPDEEEEVDQYADLFDYCWKMSHNEIAEIDFSEHPDYDIGSDGLFRGKVIAYSAQNLGIALQELDRNDNVDGNIRVVGITNKKRGD